MKILMCHNAYKFRGGEDQVFEDECWMLESNGCEVVTYQRGNEAIDHMGRLKVAANTLWNRQSYREIADLIGKEKPDVIHCHNTFPLISPAVYYAARKCNVPVIQTLHNYRLLCPKGVLLRNGDVCKDCVGKAFAWSSVRHACYKESRLATLVTATMLSGHWALRTWRSTVTRYVALTQFARDMFVEGGIPAERIRIKPNCVRPDPGMGTQPGNYAIFVGRLSPEKGIEVLLEAWTRENPTIPLWVVGTGPLEGQVRVAEEKNLNIRCLGFRNHSDVLELIAGARLLVFPSVWHETFGRSVIEAFATGTPVVATNMAPMNELILDGKTGLLFERANSTELSNKIKALLQDEELQRLLRINGRREYERRYTPDTNFQQLIGIYEEAIRAVGSRSASRTKNGRPPIPEVVRSVGGVDES